MQVSPETLTDIEFPAIISELQQYAMTAEGAHACENITLHSSAKHIQREQQYIHQWRAIIRRPSLLNNLSFPKVEAIIDTLCTQNANLSVQECAALLRYLQNGTILRTRIVEAQNSDSNNKRIEDIINLLSEMPNLNMLIEHGAHVIDSSGELIIENIPELQDAAQRRQQAYRACEMEAKALIAADSRMWQQAHATVRNNRFVLPLSARDAGKISAIIVDQSASGETLFVEPPSLLHLNNRMRDAERQFTKLCHIFLAKLSADIRAELPNIRTFTNILTYIDTIHCRAKFSEAYQCTSVDVSNGDFILNGARHPLLGAHAIPVDIYLNEHARILVIGGANAGGKTVTLKTLGLLCALFHCGMELPVSEGSALPILDTMYILIGDQQSIRAHRSTFSSRMRQLADIIQHATSRSLLLLDELAGNTDPLEGGALAIAICNYCAQKQIPTCISTHFGQVKRYAADNHNMQVATMGYDDAQDKPTYRLEKGLVGSSHAMHVAAQCGIPQHIIADAKTCINTYEFDYARRIEALGAREIAVDKQQKALMAERQQIQARNVALAQGEQRLSEQIAHGFNKQLSMGRKEIERIVRMARESEQINVNEIHTHLAAVEKSHHEYAERIEHEHSARHHENPPNKQAVHVHDTVTVSPTGTRMQVGAIRDNDRLEVMAGNIRMTVNRDQCELVTQQPSNNTPRHQFSGNVDQPSRSLDVRGMQTHVAEELLLKNIDRSIYAGIDSFAIIHGIGSGALRKSVQSLLQNNVYVVEWNHAHPTDGGIGKTIVCLKKNSEQAHG